MDYRIDRVEELAGIVKAKWDLGLDGGLVIANPIPEEYQMDFDVINKAINNALVEAEEKEIKERYHTILLEKVKKLLVGTA